MHLSIQRDKWYGKELVVRTYRRGGTVLPFSKRTPHLIHEVEQGARLVSQRQCGIYMRTVNVQSDGMADFLCTQRNATLTWIRESLHYTRMSSPSWEAQGANVDKARQNPLRVRGF